VRKTWFFGLWIICVVLGGTEAFGQEVVLNRGQDAAEGRHEDPSAETRTMRLWEDAASGALGDAEEDRPTLTIYEPFNAQEPTAAVIVIPGGSYEWLATNHEGRQLANWLNAMGITAFVLRYRVGPKYHHPVELGDAQRAI